MTFQAPATLRNLRDIVEEYNEKLEAIPAVLAEFEQSVKKIEMKTSIGGSFGGSVFSHNPTPYESTLKAVLLKSAWRHVYNGLNIETIAPAKDKKQFEMALENPPEFTLDNIRASFGDYLLDPMYHILRGLAEAFSQLDPAYKSHSKVKIGVKGLPKRVILSGLNGWGGWGEDRLKDVLNALASYQRKPLVTHQEIEALLKNEDALLTAWEAKNYKNELVNFPARGVRLRRFQNGNGHLFFEPDTLLDINRALAEFYGEVLPDVEEETTQKRQSTAVSKDLQYYPTPVAVVQSILRDVYIREGEKVLEPSCGCGRFLDALKGHDVLGIEYDAGRAAEARAKGHSVVQGNFLEFPPKPEYSKVIMNPPFTGRGYLKHINHAIKFLKPGGQLISILPATAWYDHGELPKGGRWTDLPVASFRESGTNVPTGYYTWWKDK